jgi:beta-lactamase regulating signal transducer with metallopeptidase domain
MIKKLKLVILSLSSLLFIAAPLAIAIPTYADTSTTATNDIQNNLCQGSNLDVSTTSNTCAATVPDAGTSVTTTIKKIINILSVVIGAVAVVMIIIGGFRYVTSGGNAESTKSARQTIVYAIVGLIIVALAQIIVHFVLNAVSS